MKRASVLLIAGALATMVAAQTPETRSAAPEADRLVAARRLIDAILPPETRDATFAQMITVQMANMTRGIVQGQDMEKVFAEHPDAAKVFARFVDRQRQLALDDLKQATPALIEAEAVAYARRFTVDEMNAVEAFYVSPAGRKYRAESMTIMADPEVGRWQSDVAAKAQARLQPELAKLMAELKPIIDRDTKAAHGKHS